MKAILPVAALQDYLNAVNAVVDEAILKPTDEGGLTTLAVDAAHVCMVDATLEPEGFTAHQPGDPLHVDVSKLVDVLKLAEGNGDVELHAEDGALVVKFGRITRQLSLLSSLQEPKIPDLDHDASADAQLKDLKLAIRAIDPIQDHTRITANPDNITLSAEGNTDTVEYKLPPESLRNYQHQPATSMYSNSYLFQILGNVGKVRRVSLAFSSDYPLRLAWGGGGVVAEYLVAPRIESQ